MRKQLFDAWRFFGCCASFKTPGDVYMELFVPGRSLFILAGKKIGIISQAIFFHSPIMQKKHKYVHPINNLHDVSESFRIFINFQSPKSCGRREYNRLKKVEDHTLSP